MVEAFSSRQTAVLIGITQRQLSYWRKTGLLTPENSSGGGHARYSFTDLVILKTIKKLLDSGASLQRVRTTVKTLKTLLPTLETPLSQVTLVATGDVILVFRDNTAFEAISGQEWLLPVARLEQEIAETRGQYHVLGEQIELFSEGSEPGEEKSDTAFG